MQLAGQVAHRSHFVVEGYNRWIVLGYVAFAIVAVSAVCLASGGPGLAKGELAVAAIFP
jgi:hypothetical protein